MKAAAAEKIRSILSYQQYLKTVWILILNINTKPYAKIKILVDSGRPFGITQLTKTIIPDEPIWPSAK